MANFPTKCPVCGCEETHRGAFRCGWQGGRCMFDSEVVATLRAQLAELEAERDRYHKIVEKVRLALDKHDEYAKQLIGSVDDEAQDVLEYYLAFVDDLDKALGKDGE